MDEIDQEAEIAIATIARELYKLPLDPCLIDVLENISEYIVRLEDRIVRLEGKDNAG